MARIKLLTKDDQYKILCTGDKYVRLASRCPWNLEFFVMVRRIFPVNFSRGSVDIQRGKYGSKTSEVAARISTAWQRGK
jgi:hypothetical protein